MTAYIKRAPAPHHWRHWWQQRSSRAADLWLHENDSDTNAQWTVRSVWSNDGGREVRPHICYDCTTSLFRSREFTRFNQCCACCIEFFICPIASAQQSYKITCVCLSVSQCVCRHSYGCSFSSILMKFCTVIRGPKSKTKFVWGENPMAPFLILPQFLTPVMHFQWEGSNTAVMRLCTG